MAEFSGCRTAWRQDARRCWPMRWRTARDDPDAGGDADLGRLRGHRYEEGIRWLGHAGAGRAEEGRAFGAPVRVPRQASPTLDILHTVFVSRRSLILGIHCT